jgi:hypothetical protein
MQKRYILLNDYNTATHGQWTLTALEFPTPEPVLNLVDIPGRLTGPLDLSTILTNGEPRYSSRSFRAIFESSEGDRAARQSRIAELVNRFHGQRVNIVLPDQPNHYAVGRLTVRQLYNDLAHASVEVTGVCEPWLYARSETVVTANLNTSTFTALTLSNERKPAIPTIEVTTDTTIRWKGANYTVNAGTLTSLDLLLGAGESTLEARSMTQAGRITITYREGTL